jgi:thioredoxin 1
MPDNPAVDHAPGTVLELDAERFGELIPGHPFAIVDFWAPWCAPCRVFAPVFSKAAEKHPDVLFAKVNTEQEQALAAHFNIRSIPMLMVFRDNVIVFAQAGALNEAALAEVIGAAAALDMAAVKREMDAAGQEAGGAGKTS